MKSRRLIICFVSLIAIIQIITANDELRERFLNLRSRSNSLRRPSTHDDSNNEPTAIPSTIQPESTASSTSTFEPQTTAASLRRKQINSRKPNLRLGIRNSSQDALTAEGSVKAVEKTIVSEPEDIQEFSNVDSRNRVRGTFGTHRFRPNTSHQSAVVVTMDNNENFEPEPKIVELPPSSAPLVRRPHIPRRLEKEIEKVILTPDETLPVIQKPIETPEIMDANKKITVSLESSPLSDNLSKLNSPLSKFEPSEPTFAMPFSFKHEPRPNPIRGSFKSPETKKTFLEKKTEFKLSEDQIIQNKTSKISPIKNFFEAQRFHGNDGEKETLETSETRTRSKIEIKEVNGTLYEYEYIYYYDDEVPLYDYDAPVISDEYDQIDAVNQIVEQTTIVPIPKETTTTTTTTTTSTTTTPPPPSPSTRIRQRPTSGRGRLRPNKKQEKQDVTNEIVSQKESLRSPLDLQQNIISEVETRQRGRLTHPSRQPARSRGNSRSLIQDSAPAENVVQDVKFEDQNLPTHTRFPPRATPPTHDLRIDQETVIRGLDEHLETPLIIGLNEDQDEVQINQHFQPELFTEASHTEFGNEVTTIDSTFRTDASVANLYALSKVVDADFEDTTTGSPVLDFDTPSPNDYESLYDYDLTLSDLNELDFITTVDYDLTTEKFTTPSTTTAFPTTTTSITTEATTIPVQGRGRLGGARTRGSAIARPKGLSRGQPESNIELNAFTENTQPIIQGITAAPFRLGGRLARPDIKNRSNLRTRGRPLTFEDDTNQNEMIKENVQEPTEEATPKTAPLRKPASNISRPRPGLGGRFKSKTHTEEPAKEVQTTESSSQAVAEEQAMEMSKPAKIAPRTRRPPPANRGRPLSPPKSESNRFSRIRPVAIKLETSEPEQQEKNISSTTQEPSQKFNIEESKDEEKETLTEVRQTSLNSRKPLGGKHRFNLPNKFSRARPSKVTLDEKDLMDSKTSATSAMEEPSGTENGTNKAAEESGTTVTKIAAATEPSTPLNRKGTQKPRDNRFKVPNGRTRTRGRGFIKVESGLKISDDQEPQMIPIEVAAEDEAAAPKTEVTTQVVASAGPNHRTRIRGQTRLIPSERKEKNVSKTGLSSLFRKSGLLKQNDETMESVVTDTQAVETPPEVVRNPFDALAELSGSETEIPQQDDADIKETVSETSETVVESEATTVDTTEDTPSAADEKLTRRQVLASRRSQFLG